MEGMVEGEEAWSPAMELDPGTWDHDTQPNEPPRGSWDLLFLYSVMDINFGVLRYIHI